MNKAIVHFYEFDATKSDFRDVPDEEMAVFGVLSYIVNELNVFAKLLRLAKPVETVSKPVRFASNLQHSVLLRTLAAKVFEAHECLTEIVKNAQHVDAAILLRISKSAEKIKKLASAEGHAVNRNMRNETTFHYKVKTAKKNMQTAPDDLGASIFINSMDGNTYFEFGEQLMYVQRLRRFAEANKKHEDVELLANAWLGWTLEAIKIVKSLLAEFLQLILDRVEGKVQRKRHYYVEKGLVAEPESDFLPVFSTGNIS